MKARDTKELELLTFLIMKMQDATSKRIVINKKIGKQCQAYQPGAFT